MKLVRCYFSPTRGTRKVLDCIEEAWTGCETAEIDLSDAALDFTEFKLREDDVCLAAVPSFGGRVPAAAAERMRQIRGNGAAAVLIVAYGNRAYDDTLLEGKEILRDAGFRCAAAVAAVAEHSIVRQYGAGRPDEADARELLEFGRKIRAALEQGGMREVEVPGNFPYREYRRGPLHPASGKRCTRCGACARRCPVGAIPPADPSRTDAEKCIACMRCVAVCPHRVRHVNRAALFTIAQKLKAPCATRKENELFL